MARTRRERRSQRPFFAPLPLTNQPGAIGSRCGQRVGPRHARLACAWLRSRLAPPLTSARPIACLRTDRLRGTSGLPISPRNIRKSGYAIFSSLSRLNPYSRHISDKGIALLAIFVSSHSSRSPTINGSSTNAMPRWRVSSRPHVVKLMCACFLSTINMSNVGSLTSTTYTDTRSSKPAFSYTL